MRRAINKTDEKKRTILTVLCIVLAVVCILLLPSTCKRPKDKSERQNVAIIGPTQVSAESANFILLNENSQPVQNVCWSIIEGSQYATINKVTGELILNPNAYNSNIIIQGVINDQSTTINVTGTYVEGKIVKINTETYEPIIVVVDHRNGDDRPGSSSEGRGITPGTGIDTDNYNNNSDFKSGEKKLPYTPESYDTKGDGQGKLAISISAFVVLLVSYVVAKVKSKDGELIITANAIDKILILTAPVLCFIAWCPGIDHELSAFQITLFSLSALMLQGSVIFSIAANKGNALNISLSVMAKLFIFVLTFLLLLLLIAILVITFMFSAMSHSRYEGTYVMKYDHFLDQWVGYRVD